MGVSVTTSSTHPKHSDFGFYGEHITSALLVCPARRPDPVWVGQFSQRHRCGRTMPWIGLMARLAALAVGYESGFWLTRARSARGNIRH